VHYYCMSGLSVASELEVPGAIPLSGSFADADVTIHVGPITVRVEKSPLQAPFWTYDGETFLMELDDIGRFAAIDGKILQLEPAPGVRAEDVLPFLTGTALGALIYQRRGMLLHASTVTLNNAAYAFCGDSGIGKSTLAAALCARGCTMAGDDLCRVDLGPPPTMFPDGRMFKLTDTAIDQLNLNACRGAAVRSAISKYYVMPNAAAEQKVPLTRIYILGILPGKASAARLRRLAPVDAATHLFRHTYRRPIARALLGGSHLARWSAALLPHVEIWHLACPRNFEKLYETVETLLAQWLVDSNHA